MFGLEAKHTQNRLKPSTNLKVTFQVCFNVESIGTGISQCDDISDLCLQTQPRCLWAVLRDKTHVWLCGFSQQTMQGPIKKLWAEFGAWLSPNLAKKNKCCILLFSNKKRLCNKCTRLFSMLYFLWLNKVYFVAAHISIIYLF